MLLVALTLISAVSTSISLLVSCLVKDVKQAIEAAPGVFVPQILFAGFFIKMELIPPFTRWIQYLCSLKWGMNMILINEFKDTPYAEMILSKNDVEEDLFWAYGGAMLLIIVAF